MDIIIKIWNTQNGNRKGANSLYRNLKALLVKNGLTQNDLAKILNVDKATMSMRFTGKRDFTKSEIDTIINLFGLSYEEIFFDNPILKTDIKAS